MPTARRYPFGAEVHGDETHFRIWAPRRQCVAVAVEGSSEGRPLTPEGTGFFSGAFKDLGVGTRYRIRLDDDSTAYPDPASRFQPEGPHGPSQVVDPRSYTWGDGDWPGVSARGQVLYEMHIGTFTREGTWQAAARELPELARLGVTCLEVMPVAEFPGRFGWGYDGVDLFAPTHLYGGPDDFRRFVDLAHRIGLGVILDVVYNHLGPDGNHLGAFSPDYFSAKYRTDWGEALNFDGEGSGPVREFYLANAAYWVDEYHLDGLRLDATQNIYDDAPPRRHILTDVGRRVRAAAGGRSTLIVNENEPQEADLCRPIESGGYGLDALWNDDFHHTALAALTGRTEAYYTDYAGSPQEFVAAARHGFLYQGQWYAWQKQPRGRPALDLPATAFVTFLENHDQVANSGRGLRTHQMGHPGRHRALTALLLLGPNTPMLFQGQEFAAASPFLYFADHKPDLAPLVHKGRIEFLSQFDSLSDPAMGPVIARPDDVRTFERCKLDFAERERHAPFYALTRDLLRRRRDVHGGGRRLSRPVDGAVLGAHTFLLRFFGADGVDHVLLVNLGPDLHLRSAPEPLIAPPAEAEWALLLSTESPLYGGGGTGPIEPREGGWRLPAESALLLASRPASAGRRTPSEDL